MDRTQLLRDLEASYAMPPARMLPELPDTHITVMRWSMTDCASSRRIEHPSCHYKLSLILKPMHARAWLRSEEVWSGRIPANTVRLTPPGGNPNWQSEGAFDFILLLIPPEIIDEMAGSTDVRDLLIQGAPLYERDETIAYLARVMVQALTEQPAFAEHFVDGIARAIVARVLSRAGEKLAGAGTFSRRRLAQIAAYVDANLGQDIRVSQLSALVDMSESHFAHAFRDTTGQSPLQWIIEKRIAQARNLLQRTSRSILDIALECGFGDASHFTRTFRKVTGATPSAYRTGIRRC